MTSLDPHTLRGGGGDDRLIQRFQLAVFPDPPPRWRNVDRWLAGRRRQDARVRHLPAARHPRPGRPRRRGAHPGGAPVPALRSRRSGALRRLPRPHRPSHRRARPRHARARLARGGRAGGGLVHLPRSACAPPQSDGSPGPKPRTKRTTTQRGACGLFRPPLIQTGWKSTACSGWLDVSGPAAAIDRARLVSSGQSGRRRRRRCHPRPPRRSSRRTACSRCRARSSRRRALHRCRRWRHGPPGPRRPCCRPPARS